MAHHDGDKPGNDSIRRVGRDWQVDLKSKRSTHPTAAYDDIATRGLRGRQSRNFQLLGVDAVHEVVEDLAGHLVADVEDEEGHGKASDRITPAEPKCDEPQADQRAEG
jgi:hypothetical protein